MNTVKITFFLFIFFIFSSFAQEQNNQQSKLKELVALAKIWAGATLFVYTELRCFLPGACGDSCQELAFAGACGISGQCLYLNHYYPETEAEQKKHTAQMDMNKKKKK